MKNLTNKRLTFIGSVMLLAFGALISDAVAAVPELKSGGKFFQSKGTKAEETYQERGRAGAPTYEYGKGVQWGPVLFRPKFDYNFGYDDNVFLEDHDPKSDYINFFSAATNAEMPLNGGQHLLTAGYSQEWEWFNRFPAEDHNDYTLSGGTQLNFVPFTLGVDHQFMRTVNRADTEFTSRVDRIENTTNGLMEIPFSTFFLEEEVFNLNVDYRNPSNNQFDHNDFSFYQRIGYDLSPQTQVLAEAGYKLIGYSDSIEERDGDAPQVALGLRGNLGSRMVYQAWGGAQFRIYDEDTRPDYNGFVGRGALQYDLSDVNYVVLKLDRSPQESTYDGQSYYVRNRVELQWRQQLRERIFMNARGILNYNEYSRNSDRDGDIETRRDYVNETALGVEYMMPNDIVSIYGEYKFRVRDSNTAELDYTASSASAGVRARF